MELALRKSDAQREFVIPLSLPLFSLSLSSILPSASSRIVSAFRFPRAPLRIVIKIGAVKYITRVALPSNDAVGLMEISTISIHSPFTRETCHCTGYVIHLFHAISISIALSNVLSSCIIVDYIRVNVAHLTRY